MSKFKELQPVRIEKPGWEFHKKAARYLEAAAVDGLAWVAIALKPADRTTAPAEGDCRNTKKVKHQLVSLSNLKPA